MIRHIVLIKFNPDMPEDGISALFDELHQIKGKLPGLIAVTSGRSESPEQMERGYMHGFVADFDNWDGLQAYQDNADHQRFGAKLVANAVGGKTGILCFDLSVTGKAP